MRPYSHEHAHLCPVKSLYILANPRMATESLLSIDLHGASCRRKKSPTLVMGVCMRPSQLRCINKIAPTCHPAASIAPTSEKNNTIMVGEP